MEKGTTMEFVLILKLILREIWYKPWKFFEVSTTLCRRCSFNATSSYKFNNVCPKEDYSTARVMRELQKMHGWIFHRNEQKIV